MAILSSFIDLYASSTIGYIDSMNLYTQSANGNGQFISAYTKSHDGVVSDIYSSAKSRVGVVDNIPAFTKGSLPKDSSNINLYVKATYDVDYLSLYLKTTPYNVEYNYLSAYIRNDDNVYNESSFLPAFVYGSSHLVTISSFASAMVAGNPLKFLNCYSKSLRYIGVAHDTYSSVISSSYLSVFTQVDL